MYDMFTVVVIMVTVLAVLYLLWFENEVKGKIVLGRKSMRPQWFNLLLLLGAALVIKSIFAVKFDAYSVDMSCFRIWSDMIYDNGISKFYYVDEGNGYPPGYMFVLWLMAVVRHIFGVETGSQTAEYLIKLFPMLCDLGAGAVLYLLAKRRFSEGMSLMICAIYVLNPMVVADSSMWGQVDSVFTLTILLTCWLCMEEKRIPAYFVFCLGALLKFQTIMFTPILIFTIIEQVFLRDFTVKKMLRDLAGGLGAIASMFLFAVPFGLDVVVPKYVNSLGLFEYCTVNAYNFWAILGKNWVEQTNKFLFLKCQTWGSIAIVASVLLSGFVFYKMKEDKSKYFLSMAVLISFVFLFSVRMHERYLFPAILLVLAGFILRPCIELFWVYVGLSVAQFVNIVHVYHYFMELGTTGPEGYTIGATAMLTVFMAGYLLYATLHKGEIVYEPEFHQGKANKRKIVNVNAGKDEKWYKFSITPSRKADKMGKVDFIVLFAIMILYSCFALYDLGRMSAPETSWVGEQNGSQILLDFGETKSISNLYSFTGTYEGRNFQVEVSEDGTNYTPAGTMSAGDVFKWNDVKFVGETEEAEQQPFQVNARYLRMTLLHNEAMLNELVFKDTSGEYIVPENASQYPELFDEQDEFDPELGFRSGTYFDEVYHARTAYEMIHELRSYENTHPPLGKIFISLGVRAFGMNPFGWRIVGTLFGIGMIPFMYLFGKRLFRRTWVAGVVTALFSFDFMHFTQTRIATIDVYGTFFIITMFYFMYCYAQTSFYDTDFKKTLIPLGLSGLMMGLGCASKWTAIYAGAGLAVFFFAILFKRYMEFRIARDNPRGETAGISHSHIAEVYKKNMWKTLAFCVLFFVVIPGVIYLLSYYPFRGDDDDLGLWSRMILNQKSMFDYHSSLTEGHVYSSTWYEWPTMIRPMFYYCNTVAGELKEGISAFGNPLVWWAGMFAFIYMIYRCVAKKDSVSLFLVFAYLVQYLPWVLVPRCTFSYHYFPSVPFVALMLGYTMYCFIGENKKKRWLAFAYCAAAFGLFLMFYPVLSGQPVSADYVNDGLKWMSDWALIY